MKFITTASLLLCTFSMNASETSPLLQLFKNNDVMFHIFAQLGFKDVTALCRTTKKLYYPFYAQVYYTNFSHNITTSMNSVTINGNTSRMLFMPNTVIKELERGTLHNLAHLVLANLSQQQIEAAILAAHASKKIEGILIRNAGNGLPFEAQNLSLPKTVTKLIIQDTSNLNIDDITALIQNTPNIKRFISIQSLSTDESIDLSSKIRGIPSECVLADIDFGEANIKKPSYKYINNFSEIRKFNS